MNMKVYVYDNCCCSCSTVLVKDAPLSVLLIVRVKVRGINSHWLLENLPI
jgi:hypothetical protein